MDTNAIIVIGVVAGAVLVVGVIIAGPRLKKLWFKGPGGLEGGIDVGQARVGARGHRIKAGGTVVIEDKAGLGADGDRISADGDVRIQNSAAAAAPRSRPN